MEVVAIVSIVLVAVTFIVLVGFIVRMMKTMQKKMARVQYRLQHMQTRIQDIVDVSTELQKKKKALEQEIALKQKQVEQITEDVEHIRQLNEQVRCSWQEVSTATRSSLEELSADLEQYDAYESVDTDTADPALQMKYRQQLLKDVVTVGRRTYDVYRNLRMKRAGKGRNISAK